MISFAENFIAYTEDECAAREAFWMSPQPAVNALAAMTCHRDTHDASITPQPVSTAKPAPAGVLAVAGFGHRLGLPRA